MFGGVETGSLADYVCVPEAAAATKPSNATFVQAAAAPMAALTALFPSHRMAQEYRIDSVTLRDEVGDAQPPVTEPPVTEAPSTLAPTTVAPTTLAPTTSAPESGDGDGSSLLPFALIIGGLAVIAVGAAMYLRRNAAPVTAAAPTAAAATEQPAAAAHQVAAAPTAAAPHVDITGEISRLAKLHEAGELSDDEFAELKRRILDGS